MTEAFIPPAKPIIGDEERAAVDRVLRSGMIAQGPEVAAFEQEFAEHFKLGRSCVAVNSGTSGLHLGLLSAGIGAGDEVIVPSFTFAATANSVALTDATPQAFREATLKESEPSAAALDEFLTTLKGGGIDVLIFNPSTATDTTKRIRAAAGEAHVKIVEIAEVPPTDTNFLDYFDSRLTELKEALS